MTGKPILVAVDFSQVTEAVVNAAAELALQLDLPVTLIHVEPGEPEFVGYEPDPPSVRDSVARTIRSHHRELESLASELRGRGVTVTPLLIPGAAVERILEKAAEQEVGMIVIGSHGHGALYDLIVGSVGHAVLKDARCPVLVVPSPREAEK